MDKFPVDFTPLRLNSSSLTCSICAPVAIILQLVAMECQKLHMADSPILDMNSMHPQMIRLLRNISVTMLTRLTQQQCSPRGACILPGSHNGTHDGTYQKRIDRSYQSKSTDDLESSPSFWTRHFKRSVTPRQSWLTQTTDGNIKSWKCRRRRLL